MKEVEQRKAAQAFVAQWAEKGYEKGETQAFWLDLLHKVLGAENASQIISFENRVKLNNTSFIDAYIDSTKVLIEQKGAHRDLRESIKQSDGTMLTPFQQAKRYSMELPYSLRPRWVVTCNFKSFLIYDMEQPQGEPVELLLSNLANEFHKLDFLIDTRSEHIRNEMEISIKAGELIGRLYDKFLEIYGSKDEDTLRQLNILCVRLVFCLYAEDSGVFGKKDMFHDFLVRYEAEDLSEQLETLFKVLDTPLDERKKFLKDTLKEFPYVNGGLFREALEVPPFTPELKELLLQNASEDFDWSHISPTIFGAVFESTLNPETRRSGGMHYTSIENIHKVIDPLFLDDLRAELAAAKAAATPRAKKQALTAFQEHLASLKFLDPACGSGNFLTETYLSLRRMENEAIRELHNGQVLIGFDEVDPIKVSIHQFYGIEINDFAVTVATTALWIAEAQMMQETESIINRDLEILPLHAYHNIHHANALRIDWNEVVPASELNYIMGNPPFVGARMKSKEQGEDIERVFGTTWKNIGNLDYVCCWYKKASEMMQNTSIRAALVSTNSICQGEQVANLWKPLMDNSNVHIDFAHRTFRWDSEASIKAHVHCVIVGFSTAPNNKPKIIFEGKSSIIANNINGYLLDGPNVAVDSIANSICKVPPIGIGNKPIDGKNYLFSSEEKAEFVQNEPLSEPYFKLWIGADEFLNGKIRYCLWLGECTPMQLRSMPHCLERVENVRNYRLASTSAPTRKLAERPTRFHVENMPNGNYIVIPRHSSEKYQYIPIGYMSPNTLCGDANMMMPDATLYHLGILESSTHMGWMRAVCGRLKSDYRYSKDIVYNNFPWPEPTEAQKAKIEQYAQAILDARALYPDSSLADLYDETTMPPELRKAHQQNDAAVLAAYGLAKDTPEPDIVSHLLGLYQQMTNNK